MKKSKYLPTFIAPRGAIPLRPLCSSTVRKRAQHAEISEYSRPIYAVKNSIGITPLRAFSTRCSFFVGGTNDPTPYSAS